MAYSLFISDLHLDPVRPEHLAALEVLLDKNTGMVKAYHLGA